MAKRKSTYRLYDVWEQAELILDVAPGGWKDSAVSWSRSDKYYGMFRSFSTTLKFVEDGAEFIRNSFYSQGVNSNIELEIKRLGNMLTYSDFYIGRLDFNKIKDLPYSVEINCLEGGLSADIVNNDEKEYEIYFDENSIGFQRFGFSSGSSIEDREGLTAMGLFSALIDKVTNGKITDGTYAVQSQLLDNNIDGLTSFLVFTTGRQIRKVQGPIKTSLSNFFKAVNAIFCAGMGIEIIDGKQTVVLEQREYFFSTSRKLLSINSVSDFKISPSALLFNGIKCGYSKDDNAPEKDILYWEPNSYVCFELPLSGVKNTYEVVSPYRADWTGIKEIKDLPNEIDKNYGDDYTTFIVEVFRNVYGRYHAVPAEIFKIDDPETATVWYNCRITPRRNLLRHESFIRSIAFNIDVTGTYYLPFLSGGGDEKNNMTTMPEHQYEEAYREDSPIEILMADDGYFKPFVFEITAPTDINILERMQSNFNGYIEVTIEGHVFKGIPLELSALAVGRNSNTFRLLCAPDVDLTPLIR